VDTGSPSMARTTSPLRRPASAAALPVGGSASTGRASGSPYMNSPA
jgi:hypothetical protein